MSELLFYLIVFATNIIQGITGFAGTILAMPFSIRLVGYTAAKPVLNVLGVLAGVYVAAGNWRRVDIRLLRRVCLYMGMGILAGIALRRLLAGYKGVLYILLGIFVLAVGVQGLIGAVRGKRMSLAVPGTPLLLFAGVVHGMFVCGGPLVVAYLSGCTRDRETFRRTISAVWVVLNTVIFVSDWMSGYYTMPVIRMQLVSVPVLFGGMLTGSLLYRHMSQRVFTVLTYLLLCVAGLSLLCK